jgi:hypothetical protein
MERRHPPPLSFGCSSPPHDGVVSSPEAPAAAGTPPKPLLLARLFVTRIKSTVTEADVRGLFASAGVEVFDVFMPKNHTDPRFLHRGFSFVSVGGAALLASGWTFPLKHFSLDGQPIVIELSIPKHPNYHHRGWPLLSYAGAEQGPLMPAPAAMTLPAFPSPPPLPPYHMQWAPSMGDFIATAMGGLLFQLASPLGGPPSTLMMQPPLPPPSPTMMLAPPLPPRPFTYPAHFPYPPLPTSMPPASAAGAPSTPIGYFPPSPFGVVLSVLHSAMPPTPS